MGYGMCEVGHWCPGPGVRIRGGRVVNGEDRFYPLEGGLESDPLQGGSGYLKWYRSGNNQVYNAYTAQPCIT